MPKSFLLVIFFKCYKRNISNYLKKNNKQLYSLLSFKTSFFKLSRIDILGQIIFVMKGCSFVHCRIFSRIPGLYSWNISSMYLAPVVTAKTISTYCQMSLGSGGRKGRNNFQMKNTHSNGEVLTQFYNENNLNYKIY